ncbi:uncharacterized protein LOC143279521 [Babylonia areolata]|uniref:uncharacterized protein LOC143279521 n=1 Tax=Babylonia areolata TaxID=304850 RepID=UPI003FCF14C5
MKMSSTSTEQEKTCEFIALVEERPPLWQKEHRDFLNRELRVRLFQEVAEMCGLSEETCKKKLKNLKDKMRDICNKLPKTKNGHPAFEKGEHLVRWPFYHAMLFMKDQFLGRDIRGSCHLSITQEESQQEGSCVCSPVESDDETSSESSLAQPETQMPLLQKKTRSTPRMSQKRRFADEFLSIEREQMASLRKAVTAEELKDEWSAFCTSVAYDLRKLTDPYLKMRVKSDINKLVNDAVLQQLKQDAQPPAKLSS